MDNVIALYGGAIGLNNKIQPHRLPFSETGISALEDSSDISIDRTGQAVARRPETLLHSGNFHSSYKLDDESFYIIEDRVSDAALYLAKVSNGTLSMVGILSGLVKQKVSYFKLEDKIYYSNGIDRGYLIRTDFYSWDTNTWPGPESKATFSTLPVGTIIEKFNGRALSAVDNELFYSEYSLLGLTDLVRNRYRFESKLTLIKSVQTGVYVSDTKAIYFLNGLDPSKWTMQQVTTYPAIEGAVEQDLVDPMFFGVETQKLACVIGTIRGPIVGLSDGTVFNLIDKVVVMPSRCNTKSGAIMVVDETMIIQSGE